MNQPLYKQVTDTVIQRIAEAQYPPGSILPSEFELAAELNVSQGTARKALIELENSGIIERRQGKGSFVTLRTPENSLFHFFKLRTKDNDDQVVPQKIHETIKARKAKESEKRALDGKPERVFEITRVRKANGKVVCQEISIVAEDRFPGLKQRAPLPNTLYVMFQQSYSCIIISASEKVTADILKEPLASMMEQPENTPVLVAHREAYDLQNRCVELRKSTYLTNEAYYSVDMR